MPKTRLCLAILLLLLPLLSAPVWAEDDARAPGKATTQRDLIYATVDGKPLGLDLYLPKPAATKPPLILWVHGGGWRKGDKSRCHLKWIVDSGYAVASVQYRLSDVAIFPAQIHDVKGALRWLRANADRLGFDATRVGIGGSSAGGHLAALMGTSAGDAALEGTVGGNLGQSSRVQAVYDMFGPSDLVTIVGNASPLRSARGPVGLLLGGAVSERQALAKQASPVNFVTSDDAPFLIAHGDRDRLVPLDQSTRLDALLDAANVPSDLRVQKGAGHGGAKFTSADLRTAIRTFFAKHLRGSVATTPTTPTASTPTATTDTITRYAAPGRYTRKHQDLALKDTSRGKTFDLRVSYPTEAGTFPVLVWSHGLRGSRTGYQPLVAHWVSRGYVVVQPTHMDSLKIPAAERAKGMREWSHRPKDIAFVLDSLKAIGSQLKGLTGTLDLTRIAMGGHSYGAHTTMLVGDATTQDGTDGARGQHGDPRPKAFFVLSGQGTGTLFDKDAWKTIKRPMFVVTGTKDAGRNGQPFTWRTEAFTHAAPGDKFLAILEGADHSFGGVARARRPNDRRPANAAHVDTIRALSTLFFDAYVKGDPAAGALMNTRSIAGPSAGAIRMTEK